MNTTTFQFKRRNTIIFSQYKAVDIHSYTEQTSGICNLKYNSDLALKSVNLLAPNDIYIYVVPHS